VSFLALAAAVAIVWRLGERQLIRAVPIGFATVMCTSVVLAISAEPWCRPSRCDYIDTTPTYIRSSFFSGWTWIDEHVTSSTIAYTGNNLPYPLVGRRLTNRVMYVNIDGRPRWRFHDYDLAYRTRRFTPVPPVLATSSGELMPVSRQPGIAAEALRPRYERMQGIRDAWIANLQRFEVAYLFISALSAYEIDYNWHDDRGFPIEESWAKDDPEMFQLMYENPQIRIYAVKTTNQLSQTKSGV
jgi:hypothetical protein